MFVDIIYLTSLNADPNKTDLYYENVAFDRYDKIFLCYNVFHYIHNHFKTTNVLSWDYKYVFIFIACVGIQFDICWFPVIGLSLPVTIKTSDEALSTCQFPFSSYHKLMRNSPESVEKENLPPFLERPFKSGTGDYVNL